MKKIQRWVVVGLLALNVALLTALFMRTTHESTAYAQGRGRGSYVVLPGHVNGNLVYYVLETNSGKLAALTVNPGARTVTSAALVDVNKMMDQAFRK